MKYLDNDGLLYVKGKLDTKFNSKVDKISGKGLSENDYTTIEKSKLAGIEANANNYSLPTASATTLGGVMVGTGLAITNGVLSATGGGEADSVQWENVLNKPTKLSQFTNDGDGTTGSKYATESYVATNGGKIDKIQVNGVEQSITNKMVNITVPTNNNQLTNGAGYITGINSSDVTTALGFTPYNATNPNGYQTLQQVEDTIDTKISSTYKASGSVAFESLPTLAKANLGKVYNVTNSFTTTSSFVEGAGKNYPAGTNVVIVEVGTGSYKYDTLSGFVDLSGYVQTTDLEAITNAEIDTIFA